MFKDHFSKQSSEYLRFRPVYPSSLISRLCKHLRQTNLAWDCATGNGQAAILLSECFQHVIASDASEQQISRAQTRANITYLVFPAESTPLEDQSVDLITVAQALHWFDFDRFYDEVKRVMKQEGMIAVWAYGLQKINSKIDPLIAHLYENILGDFWPAERKYVEEKYQTIPFPFKSLNMPEFYIRHNWNLQQQLGYLRSWSSVQKYMQKYQIDPLIEFETELRKVWGDPQITHSITWPIYLKAGVLP